MKKLLTILFFATLIFSNLHSAEWKIFELDRPMYDIVSYEDHLWGLTEKDLISINKITGERKYYDKSNSGIENFDYDTRMVLDSSGNLWFSYSKTTDIGISRYGITKYNIKTDEWTSYSEGLYPYMDGIYFTGPIAVDSKGQLWIYMQKKDYNTGGLAIFKEEETEVINLDSCEAVSDFFIDKKDNIWFTIGNKICRYDGVNLNKFYPCHNSNECNGISSLSIDGNGYLWFTNTRFLYKYDYLSRSLKNMAGPSPKYEWNTIYHVFCDSQDIIWMLTDIGVFSFSGDELIKHELFKNGFSIYEWNYVPYPYIFGFHEDNGGNIWSYFNNGRIVFFDGEVFMDLVNPEITFPAPSLDNIIIDSKSNAYISYQNHLYKYMEWGFQEFTCPENIGKMIIDNDDNVWLINDRMRIDNNIIV